MPFFRNPQTGEVSAFYGEDALSVAQAGWQAVDDEPIQTQGGQVAAGDVAELAKYRGITAADPVDVEMARYGRLEDKRFQDEYGQVGGQVRAGVEGALSGASLGLYDVIADKAGWDTEQYAKANPNARTAGEVAGIVGASVIPGLGEGRLASLAAKTPAGAITAATTKLGKSIGGLKGAAAGAALEGAGYALGQTTSQLIITDEPLTAEAVVAEMGRNTLFGLGVGGAAGALAHGLGAAGQKLVGKVDGMSAPVVDLKTPVGKMVARDMARAVAEVDEAASRILGQVDEVAPPVVAAVDNVAVETQPAVAPSLVEVPEAKAINRLERKKLTAVGDQLLDDMLSKAEQARMTGGTGKEFVPDVRKLKRMRAELQQVFEEAEQGGSARAANAAAKSYEGYLRELGAKLEFDVEGHLARVGEKAAAEAAPPVAAAPQQGVPMMVTNQMKQDLRARGLLDDDIANMTPQQAHDFLAQPEPAQPAAMPEMAPPPPSAAALENVRSAQAVVKKALGLGPGEAITEKHIKALLSQPTTELLPTLGALDDYYKSLGKFAELNGDEVLVNQLDAAMSQLGESVSAASGGAKLSDGDKALIAAAIGSEALEATGFESPIDDLAELALMAKLAHGKVPGGARRRSGGLLRSMIMRAGSYGTRQAARDVGIGGTSAMGQAVTTGLAAPLGYHGFGKLFDSVLGQRALAGVGHGAVSRIGAAFGALSKGVKVSARPASLTGMSLLRSTRFGYTDDSDKPAPKTNLEAFKQRQEELAAVMANPDAAQAKVHAALAPMRQVNPVVADHVEMISIAVPQYLAGKMPKDPGVLMRFGKSTWKPSDYEILQFGESVKGALAPMEVFEDALDGKVTPQAVEAVRTLYPKLFERMQLELWQRADELREKLDYSARIRVSTLYDIPVDSTMRPDFRQFMIDRNKMRAETQAQAAGSMGGRAGTPTEAEPLTGPQQLLKG